LAGEEGRDRSTPIEDLYSEYTVYDMHYEKIGKIDDLFVDENDNPEYLGVKMGFLGTSSTLIPVDLVRVNDKRRLVEVAADKETVKNGPTFSDDREITSEFERQVFDYYRVETRQASIEREAYGAYYSNATGRDRVDLQPGSRVDIATGDVERRERPISPGDEGPAKPGSDRTADENEIRVQRNEEELVAGTRQREAGAVNVRKRVRTDRERLSVPKKR
jgi:stress response protein YsnF